MQCVNVACSPERPCGKGGVHARLRSSVWRCSKDELVRREGVVQKLQTRLPSKAAAQLAHLNSASIITLYNHPILANRGACTD